MMSSITIVDYGMGNILSVARAFERCGAAVSVVSDPDLVRTAERLVLPGVGAFKDGMDGLRQHGLAEAVKHFADSGRPLLGICLGMQMLFDMSEEFGEHPGLGIISGRVVAIPATGVDGSRHKIPHIGWNELSPPHASANWDDSILRGVPAGTSVYFVHSFTAFPADEGHRLADSFYGGRQISAAVRRDKIFGCQFHPEKSGEVGLQMLTNFLAD